MSPKIRKFVTRFLADESGPTSVEYAMMLALIIVGTIAALLTAGDVQQNMWIEMSDDIKTATGQD